MKLNLIAAIGKQGQLGLNGKLPWKDKEDLRWFKEMTTDSIVVVGYNTFESVKHLNETNGRIFICDAAQVTRSVLETMSELLHKDKVWIAGGAKTYKKWGSQIDRWFIAQVDYDGPADTYFPFHGSVYPSDSDEYDNWVPFHRNSTIPVCHKIQVLQANGTVFTALKSSYVQWYHSDKSRQVIAYRIQKVPK